MIEAILNRLRGTGTIIDFGYVKNVHVTFNGNHLYGLYLAIVVGLLSMNLCAGLAVLIAYLIGESKGWGKWVGSLSRVEPWTEKHLADDYADAEGRTFPFIHQIANSICKEQIDGTFEQKCKQYKKYATLALALRGFYWWFPVYLVMAAFGVISWHIAVIAGVVLGLMFPLACEIGKRWKFERVYDLKVIKLSFSPGWENQEVVYGIFQGMVIAIIIVVVL